MKFFKNSKSSASDYQTTLAVFAEMEFQTFGELSECAQKELVGAWMADEENQDEVIDMLITFKQFGILEEAMYESINPKQLGEAFINFALTGDHIKSINIDMDEAFGDYLMSLDGYESDEDQLRKEDNLDRMIGLDKVKHQRMGI